MPANHSPEQSCSQEPQEVDIDQRALVNILSRYPGTFDVLRELIQNADDAEAPKVEVYFETEGGKFQPDGVFNDVGELQVRRWIIRNQGSFKPRDWKRLGKIAAGNDDSTKVGAFGVGFYSVLSKSDRPLVKSNGKSLQFSKGKDGKLCKQFAPCSSTDGWTSVELDLRVPEPLPVLADLAKFLISSLSFLTSIHTISVSLDNQPLLHLQKESCESPVDISIPAHLKRFTPSRILGVKSVQRTVQRITIDAAEWAFALCSTQSSPLSQTPDALVERSWRSAEDRQRRNSTGAETILQENAFTHDLYSATIDVDLKSNLEMKRGVESNMKSLPSSFCCKNIYFTSEQYDSLACIRNSSLPKAKHLARLFFGPQGIVPENSGRLFIGQSTNQTTGIGLHISAHFLPTMERSAIDLANGQVAAWNNEVLWVCGLLARIIYEEEMHSAKSKNDGLATELGLRTMTRFAFGSTSPHSDVRQILQDAFFSCCHDLKSPFPVVSDTGLISCASDLQFRQSNRELFFLKKYRLIHTDVEERQHSEIVKRYDIPLFKYADILREFEAGVTYDTMKSFFAWWEGSRKNSISVAAKDAGKKFCKEFASRGVVRSSRGVDIALKKIECFTFFPLPDDLSPQNNIYIDITTGMPTCDAVRCFGWDHLSLLDWVEYACTQARQLTPDEGSDLGRRILRVLVQFALVEEPTRKEWHRVAELMKNLQCIPTNRGLRLPTESYFDEADICRNLPVVIEHDFDDIPLTQVAEGGGFLLRRSTPEHVRRVLVTLGVHPTIEWKEMIERLEAAASEESNDRLLHILFARRELSVQLNDLRRKNVFYSKNQTRVPATELHFPNEEIRRLGLPILALPRSSVFLSQNVDPTSVATVESFLGNLGIQRYPSLKKIIDLAASNEPEIHRSALQYLLSNLESRYNAYKPDDFANVAFIPTKKGTLARLDEVFASDVWEKLKFEQVPEARRRDLLRLGVKDDPSADTIVKHLRAPKDTLPDVATATLWFNHLSSYGNLPVLVLRERFSTIPFVPVKLPGSSDSSPLEYIPPKDCFITSETKEHKEHYRNIFPFVDFGPNGNSFLESCCAKKSPDASDIIRKIVQGPEKYLGALENNTDLYREDLRTIALQFDSIPEDDRKAMRGAAMFLAFRQHVDAGKLLSAYKVIIGDWESRDFGGNVYLAPKDDMIEKMYHKMGAEYLGAYVRYHMTHGAVDKHHHLPFTREQIIQRVRCFMRQRDNSEKTRVSFYNEESTEEFWVKVCKTLTMKKTLQGADAMEAKHVTDPVSVKVGIEIGEAITLWVLKGSSGIAVELCRVLLKTFGPNDVLLLASLIAMDDDTLKSYYGSEMKSVQPNTPSKDPKRFRIEFRVPPHLVGVVKVMGARVHLIGFRSSSRKTISLEDGKPHMRRAIESSRGSDSNGQPDFNEPCRPQPNSDKYNSQCKEAHKISLTEQSNPIDEGPQIKFFLADDARRDEPPQAALQEFAKLVSRLASVFGLDASRTCHMFWKDTDNDLMAFNRDKKYVFFNLAHYFKFYYTKSVEEKRVVLDWFLITAHEIAHNVTLEHNEYHGSLSARIVATYLPVLYKDFSCFGAGEALPSPRSS